MAVLSTAFSVVVITESQHHTPLSFLLLSLSFSLIPLLSLSSPLLPLLSLLPSPSSSLSPPLSFLLLSLSSTECSETAAAVSALCHITGAQPACADSAAARRLCRVCSERVLHHSHQHQCQDCRAAGFREGQSGSGEAVPRPGPREQPACGDSLQLPRLHHCHLRQLILVSPSMYIHVHVHVVYPRTP